MKKIFSALLCLIIACIMIFAGCKQAFKGVENLLYGINSDDYKIIDVEPDESRSEKKETEKPGKASSVSTSSVQDYTDVPEPDQNEFGHYTYSFLNRPQKTYYKAIVAAAEDLNTDKFLISKRSLNDDDASDNINLAFTCVLADRPDLFWLKSNIKTFVRSDNGDIYAQLEYSVSDLKALNKMREKLDQRVEELFYQTDNLTYFEKEVYFHNYICENTQYEKISDFSRTAYGVLIEGKGSCEGYSKAMQLLCNAAEINCITVRGADSDGNPHMWNKIEISGKWYALDVTWDDPVNTDTTVFDYFNLTDKKMAETHKTDIVYTAKTLPEVLENLEFNYCTPTASGTEYSASAIE